MKNLFSLVSFSTSKLLSGIMLLLNNCKLFLIIISKKMFCKNNTRPISPISCMGLTFDNPIGFTADLNEFEYALNDASHLGFAHVELSIRPPFIFKDYIKQYIKRIIMSSYTGKIGFNIQQKSTTSSENLQLNFLTYLEEITPYANYISLDISNISPIKIETLDHLLQAAKMEQSSIAVEHSYYFQLGLKISSALSDDELVQIGRTVLNNKLDFISVANTSDSAHAVAILAKELDAQIPIISSGNINSLTIAQQHLAAHANLLLLDKKSLLRKPNLINEIVRNLN